MNTHTGSTDHIQTYINPHPHNVHTHTQHTHTHTHTNTHTHTHTHTHTYARTHTHTDTHARTHTPIAGCKTVNKTRDSGVISSNAETWSQWQEQSQTCVTCITHTWGQQQRWSRGAGRATAPHLPKLKQFRSEHIV